MIEKTTGEKYFTNYDLISLHSYTVEKQINNFFLISLQVNDRQKISSGISFYLVEYGIFTNKKKQQEMMRTPTSC